MSGNEKDKTIRLIVGISGASGAIYGIRTLQAIQQIAGVESHLVVSKAAEITLACETDMKLAALHDLADVVYADSDIGAAIASGSFANAGMLIAPCSIRSMSEIATGTTATLLTRAADVALKERRRLVLMLRETAAAFRSSAQHAGAERHGRDHRPARARFLCLAEDHRRHRQSLGRPGAGSVRTRHRKSPPLGRSAHRWQQTGPCRQATETTLTAAATCRMSACRESITKTPACAA